MSHALPGSVPATRAAGAEKARASFLLILAAAWLPLAACGGGPTAPDRADVVDPVPGVPHVDPTPRPVAPDATCEIKGFKAEALNFVGQTVFPKVIRVRVTNPQAA